MESMSSSDDGLADELITEILIRLPSESLLRFRSLSKYWKSLIDSPKFIKSHLFLNRTRNIFALHVEIEYKYKFCSGNTDSNLLFSSELAGVDLVKGSTTGQQPRNIYVNVEEHVLLPRERSAQPGGSCDGLICYWINSLDRIVVVNLSTRKGQILSPPKKTSSRFSFSCIGFGYDQTSDGYKVVVMQAPLDHGDVVDVNIYDFKLKVWGKDMKFPCNVNNYRPALPPCCINGGIHWLMRDHSFSGFENGLRIATFDLAREKLVVSEYDAKMFGYPICGQLRVLGGYLSLSCKHYDDIAKVVVGVDIWMMKEYGVKESWSKFVSFEDRDLMPLALSNCRKQLLVDQVTDCCHCRCRLHWYDVANKSFRCTHSIRLPEAACFEMCEDSLVRLENESS